MPKKKLTHSKSQQDEVRPIGARALKSAIDTLRPYLQDATVLDLFAGQGRFGITASQEGINSVTFVEKNRQTAFGLKAFVEGKQFPKSVKSSVLCQDVFTFLATCGQTFDVVFADPPFPIWNANFEKQLLDSIVQVLKPSSIFLVKHPSRVLPCSQSNELSLFKSSEFGESRLIYFRYEK